jgi:hypothetical protein
MVHGILAATHGQQLPSRGSLVLLLLGGLVATTFGWIVVSNFRGLGDRILKDSQQSARNVPLAGPTLRRVNLRLLGSEDNIDKAGRLGQRATAWVFAIVGPVIVLAAVLTLFGW